MRTFHLLALLLCISLANAQSMREKISLNPNWRFAKGHAANPGKDFNYGLALSFSKRGNNASGRSKIEPRSSSHRGL